jgi:hypothetical protein
MFFPDQNGQPLTGEELVQAKVQYMNMLLNDYLKARQIKNSNAFFYKGQKIAEFDAVGIDKLQTLVIDDLAAKIADFAANELLTMDNNPPA